MNPSPKPHQYIFINGPQMSGKDTAASFIMKEYVFDARHMKFASPLKNAARQMFGVSQLLWDTLEQQGHAHEKNMPRAEFFGKSWREVLIWLSETCMKPVFGDDVFGQLFAREALQRTSTKFTVVSDCGFIGELNAVAKQVGPQNCFVLQLYRDGRGFEGDSRGYIEATMAEPGITFLQVQNIHEKDMFRRQILIRVNKILGGNKTYD